LADFRCIKFVEYGICDHVGPILFSYHRKEHGTPLRVCPAVTLLRTGGKDLRLSAAYPKDYGREVARLHVEAMASWINKFVGNWREPFHLYLGYW